MDELESLMNKRQTIIVMFAVVVAMDPRVSSDHDRCQIRKGLYRVHDTKDFVAYLISCKITNQNSPHLCPCRFSVSG